MLCSRRIIRIALPTVFVLLAPTLGSAQQPSSAAPAAAQAEGTVDVRMSKVFVLVNKSGIGHDHGVVGQLQSGTIHLNQQTNAGALVFDLKSFAADAAEARKAVGLEGESDRGTRDDVTANLLGPNVLDTSRFPTAKFTIDSSMPAQGPGGAARFRLVGSFTLHGVTKPLTLDCDVTPIQNGQRLRTKFKILQTNYGIKPFSKAFGAIGVADELTIWGDVYVAVAGH